MQDGARPHTARVVKDWFAESRINVFNDWPGNSPDLNPIENLWAIMKHRLKGRDTSSVPKLTTAVEQIWDDLGKTGKDIIENLALSVPDRLEEVKTRKGRPTKY